MIRGLLISGLLSLCLVLTGLAATVAQTRMAAAGGYCGTGHAQILLDAAGLPLLDADGTAIAPPDCPLCTLLTGLPAPDAPAFEFSVHFVGQIAPLPPHSLGFGTERLDHPARGPPAPV